MPVTNRFTHACSSQSPIALSRRGFLQVGAIPGLGIGLAELLRGQASAVGSVHTPKAKSVILVWLQGGVSHHDTFDMKPDAATEIRGPFQPIATRLPGVHVCEHMPEMAIIVFLSKIEFSMFSYICWMYSYQKLPIHSRFLFFKIRRTPGLK